MNDLKYKTIQVQRYAPALGAEVSGVDLRRPLPAEQLREVKQAIHEHLVLFFHDQDISPLQQTAFARQFGEICEYPFIKGVAPETPDVVEIAKYEHETKNFGGLWHSDSTYLERPPMFTLLSAKEIPEIGGDTLFANMYQAFENLSAGMQEMLLSRKGVFSSDLEGALYVRDFRVNKNAGDVQTLVEHPVVRTHPATGRKALYVNRAHTLRFADMTVEESKPILDYLYSQQTRPEYTCRFRWRNHSLAMWDNRATQHNPINDYHGHRRIMQRIMVRGERPV